MPVIITYDVERTTSTIHTEVKNAMKDLGYSDHVPINSGGNVKLPNTTLVKENATPEQATTALQDVCKKKSATLEKYIALTFTYENGRVKDFN